MQIAHCRKAICMETMKALPRMGSPCFRKRFRLERCFCPSLLGCCSPWLPLPGSSLRLPPEEFGLLAVPEGLDLTFSSLLG